VVQEYPHKIYFAIFGHSYKFLRILEFCTIFWELNQLKTTKNPGHTTGPEPGPELQRAEWQPAMHGRPEGRLGHGLLAWSRRGGGPRVASGALACGHRAQPVRGTAQWHGRRGAGGG
jgi:hypothetical protein